MPGLSWFSTLWSVIDDFLRSVNDGLRRAVRWLRILRAFLIVGVLLVIGAVVGAFVQPAWMPLWFAIAVTFLVIPFLIMTALVAAPLRAKSVVRLIDKGYPANAREMGIRIVAQKLHDESIRTEELLVDTAVNEARKAVQKYREVADKLLDEDDEGSDVSAPSTSMPEPKRDPAARCAGTTKEGRPCRRRAATGSAFCPAHGAN